MHSNLFFFLIITASLSLFKCKFSFQFFSFPPISQPSCSVSGIKTVHLPSQSQKGSDPIHLRVLFASNSIGASTRSIDLFDLNSHRIDRIELTFTLNHLQIAFSDLQSPWLPLRPENGLNVLEIDDISEIQKNLKFNGKSIPPNAFIPEYQSIKFNIVYQEDLIDPSQTGDSDWVDLLQDESITSNLFQTITWQPPVSKVELHNQNQIEQIKQYKGFSSVDSIIFDETLSIQLVSGQVLSKGNYLKTTFNPFRGKQQSKQRLHQSTAITSYTANAKIIDAKTVTATSFLIVSFIIYLGILIKLSKMTSIRPVKKVQDDTLPVNDTPQSTYTPHSSTSFSSLSKSKLLSDAAPLAASFTISLSDSLIQSPAVLKVSVPAALSLADNRHILFPSKLRNFQK